MFHAVIEKLAVLFKNYQSRGLRGDHTVATLKLDECNNILKHLSSYTNPSKQLTVENLCEIKAYFDHELNVLAVIRQKGGTIQSEGDLDGSVKTCSKVLDKLLDYWAISALSIAARKKVDDVLKLAMTNTKNNKDVMEDDPIGILEIQMILFMIDVDIKSEIHQASKSTMNALFSLGAAMVSSIVTVNPEHIEARLRTEVYNHLVKMSTTLPSVQNDEFKYMEFVNTALNEAFAYEARYKSGAYIQLKSYLDIASTKIYALTQFKSYEAKLKITCEDALSESKIFVNYLKIVTSGNKALIEAARETAQQRAFVVIEEEKKGAEEQQAINFTPLVNSMPAKAIVPVDIAQQDISAAVDMPLEGVAEELAPSVQLPPASVVAELASVVSPEPVFVPNARKKKNGQAH